MNDMKTRRVTRYLADCGRGFWNKKSCEIHEVNCTCWTNPRNKTCKTCEHGDFVNGEPEVGQDSYWDCYNEDMTDCHSGAPNGIDYISVNCIGHKLKARN